MADRETLESLFEKHGFSDFRWIDPASIIVAQWVRMKCLFGCPDFGKSGACPPHTPPVDECARFFRDYKTAVLFHFQKAVEKPEDRHDWSRAINSRLLELEREIFLKGWVKAFLLPMDSCTQCQPCAGTRTGCTNPKRARPSPDAMAVDVFATVLGAGYPIEVLSDCRQAMNRYALLMIA